MWRRTIAVFAGSVVVACSLLAPSEAELRGDHGPPTRADAQSDSTGGSGGASGGASGASATDGGGWPVSCTDGARNGSETDVDCGGSCPACENGKHCATDADCASAACAGNLCCTETKYYKDTGQISATATVCCDGNDERVDYSDCATSGSAHYANPEEPNCAVAGEGANNNGSACAQVTCLKLTCG